MVDNIDEEIIYPALREIEQNLIHKITFINKKNNSVGLGGLKGNTEVNFVLSFIVNFDGKVFIYTFDNKRLKISGKINEITKDAIVVEFGKLMKIYFS